MKDKSIDKLRMYFQEWVMHLENKEEIDFEKYKNKNNKYICNLNSMKINENLKEEIIKILLDQKLFLINKEKEKEKEKEKKKTEIKGKEKSKTEKSSKTSFVKETNLTNLIKINNTQIESFQFKCIIELNNICYRLNEITSNLKGLSFNSSIYTLFKKTQKEIFLLFKFLNIEKINKVLNGLNFVETKDKEFDLVLNFCKVNKNIISKYNNDLEKIYKILTRKNDVIIFNENRGIKIENNQVIISSISNNTNAYEKIVFFDDLKQMVIGDFFENLIGFDSVIINCNGNNGSNLINDSFILKQSFSFGYDSSNFNLQIPQLATFLNETNQNENSLIVLEIYINKITNDEMIIINIPKFTNPINIFNKYFDTSKIKLKDVIYSEGNKILERYITKETKKELPTILRELEESFVINEFINIIKIFLEKKGIVYDNDNDIEEYSLDKFFENPKKSKLYKALELNRDKYLNIVLNFTNNFDDNLFLLTTFSKVPKN